MNISEIVNVCENNEYYTCVIVFRTMNAKKEVYNKLMKWKEKFQSTIMSNIMNKYEISFINGSRIILILSNYNTRGMKCDKLFYEDGIEKEIVHNDLLPMIRHDLSNAELFYSMEWKYP